MSDYKDWLPSLLPAPLAGPWGRSFARIMGLPVDTILADAKDAVDQLGPADCPDDGLAAHGWARGIVQLSGETPDRYRRRLVGAWESWAQAGRKPSIRAALNGYGLHGVTVETTAENPWGPSPEWAWFTVRVSGYVAAGEAEVGAFNVGTVYPEGAGLGIQPLIVGEFTVGQWVVGITARPATVASIRTAITTWKATRDRCVAVVFTWADTGAPHVALRGHATFDGGIMSATLTPVAAYDTGSLVVAENGELWSNVDGPSPFQPVFQRIADRLAFGRDALIGGLDWNGELSCVGGTASSFTIAVGPINSVVVMAASSIYYVLASGGANVTQTAIEGGGDLQASKTYHLYGYRNGGGGLAFELSLTEPGGSRRFKLGDTTRRYLGCFLTNGTGEPLPFDAVRGHYRYRRGNLTSSPELAAGLRATTRTTNGESDQDITVRIPAHARLGHFRALVNVGDATTVNFSIKPVSTDVRAAEQFLAAGGDPDIQEKITVAVTRHPRVGSTPPYVTICHGLTTDGTTTRVSLLAEGWEE